METFEWGMVVGIVAILGFLWKLHTDMDALGQRIAKLEGLFEGVLFQVKPSASDSP